MRIQVDQQHDRARLRSRIREKLLRSDQGIWQLRFPGKPCRELRATGLCLVMAEAFPSRRILLRVVEFAADGLLRAGADRRRCPQEWRRGARDRRILQSCAEYAGGEKREVPRRAARLSPDRWLQVARSGSTELETHT